MELHKLLSKQLSRYLPEDLAQNPEIQGFIKAVHDSYCSFDRDHELSSHAFHISELEYQDINATLSKEVDLRKQSIEKLKNGLKEVVDDSNVQLEDDDLLGIVEYLNKQIVRRKQLEEQQEVFVQSLRQLALVASANHNGVLFTNQQGRIFWSNEGFQNISGYAHEEIMGKTPIELSRGELTDKEVLHQMIDCYQSAQSFSIEIIMYNKNGSHFWARVNGQPVFDDHGNVSQFFSVIEDISKFKEAQNALKLSEEKYRNIIANMNLGLLEVDLEDRIQFANQSFLRMSGFDISELLGKEAARLFTDGVHRDFILKKKDLRINGEGDAYEVPVRNRSGELKWWLISGAPRTNEKGEVVGTIGIHLDITSQKKQEEDLQEARIQAEESSRSKAAFLANMSHEIRTPLNAITGMLRELSKTQLNDYQRPLIGNAEISTKHLLSIINNILDISKIEAGEFQMEEITFNLKEVITETSEIISGQTRDKGLDLSIKISDQLNPVLLGDPGRIRQILLNLLGNSIKFTEKGQIGVSCELLEDKPGQQLVKLVISDSGIGMDQSYLKNLFNKFSQEDSATARKYGGTGLGMAITYQLVQLMDGTIEVSSEKGVGTAIALFIPLKKGKETIVEKVITEENFEELRGIKLLLVEDNEWNRMVANHSLSMYDVQVTEADNGKIALEAVKREKFDIILMDVQMPVMDGFEATAILRNEMHVKTPIIALTANAFKKETDRCLELGMNDYIIKPYDEKLFFSTIVKNLQIKNPTNMEHKLYDLTELKSVSRGDKMFFNKMLRVFVDQLPGTFGQIEEGVSNHDYSAIKAVVHKIKPSLANLGIRSAVEQVKCIEETETENGITSADVDHSAEILVKILKDVKAGLETEIIE